jgi:hypothetical protein
MSELFLIKANSHFRVFVDLRVNCQKLYIINWTWANSDIGFPNKVLIQIFGKMSECSLFSSISVFRYIIRQRFRPRYPNCSIYKAPPPGTSCDFCLVTHFWFYFRTTTFCIARGADATVWRESSAPATAAAQPALPSYSQSKCILWFAVSPLLSSPHTFTLLPWFIDWLGHMPLVVIRPEESIPRNQFRQPM